MKVTPGEDDRSQTSSNNTTLVSSTHETASILSREKSYRVSHLSLDSSTQLPSPMVTRDTTFLSVGGREGSGMRRALSAEQSHQSMASRHTAEGDIDLRKRE